MGGKEEQANMVVDDKMGDESSEDESEFVPKHVDNYWLEDGEENPISFTTLPLHPPTGHDEISQEEVFLRGTADNGLQRVFVKAVAWRLDLPKDGKPAFHVKTEKYWTQLLKPRKIYEGTIRSILVVAQFLNYALIHPDDPERTVWNHLNDIFRSFEVKPSRSDLYPHIDLIEHLIFTKKGLEGSIALQSMVPTLSKKKLAFAMEDTRQDNMKRSYDSDDEPDVTDGKSIAPSLKRLKSEAGHLDFEEDMDDFGEEMDLEEVGDLSETVCSICDNGGDVLCCDGLCMRSFHLNKEAAGASDASCSSLGFSKAEVERMEKFFCPNCKHKEHQCYICGKLGCSDDTLGAAQEVFMCDAAICGHFYHPDCVAEMLTEDESKAASLAESIRNGHGFSCPMHKCRKCGKGEVKEDDDLQFGVCRRCPRVWHRQCFPSSILLEATDDEPQRAWENLLPGRILIYCKRHKINSKLGTPVRDHVKFPSRSIPSTEKRIGKSKVDSEDKKIKLSKLDSQARKRKSDSQAKKSKLDSQPTRRMSDSEVTRKKSDSPTIRIKPDVPRPVKSKLDPDGSVSGAIKSKTDLGVSVPQSSKNRLDVDGFTPRFKQERSAAVEQRTGKAIVTKQSTMPHFKKAEPLLQNRSKSAVYTMGKTVAMESEVRSMVDAIIEKSKNSVTLESVQNKQVVPLCYRRFSKSPDKKYSLVKIESIIRAMRKAVETLEKGGTIEDAKITCSANFIKFLEGCKNELKVYLAPFLHGMRYTSFGRHFTKTDKLKEVVERLHCYVQDGDMVVDFCCGANEFSLLMREKLAKMGKKCEFKNFDIIQPKDDFNFEKTDWFKVKQDQLPSGSRLIMGLNPPFGVKGQLANQFIDHALNVFKPKLIILIVPKETERLDRKKDAYDLVWEDLELLKGESFYLPGSVDKNEMPISQWNTVAPPLFLWSRPDWTPRHREIAQQQGHISKNSTPGPSRFAGNPWRPQLQALSSALLVDADVDKKRSSPVVVESRIEPRIKTAQTASVSETSIKEDTSSTSKLKETSKDFTFEPVDKSEQSCGLGTAEKPEERRAETLAECCEETKETKETHKLGQQSRRESDEREVIKDNQRNKSSERSGRGSGKAETPRHDDRKRESPERRRRTLEAKYEASRHDSQGRKSVERYSRNVDAKNDTSRYDDQRRKSPERYWRSSETKHGTFRHEDRGRKSPDRYGHSFDVKADSSRPYSQGKKSPERYGRIAESENDVLRHGEQRKLSPERYGQGSETKLESARHYFPGKYGDLESFRDLVSRRDDYHDLVKRVSSDKDYHDADYGSPDRRNSWRPEAEDAKRSWNIHDNYGSKRASEVIQDLERASSYRSKEFRDLDIQGNLGLYEAEMAYRKDYSDSQVQGIEGAYQKRDYLDQDAQGVGNLNQDGLSLQGIEGGYRKREYGDPDNQGGNDFGLRGSYLKREYLNIQGSEGSVRSEHYRNLDVQGAGGFDEAAALERIGRRRDFYHADVLGGKTGGIHGLKDADFHTDRQQDHLERSYKTEPIIEPYIRYGMQEMDLGRKSSYHLGSGDGVLPLPEQRLQHLQMSGRGLLESGLSINPALPYPSMYGSIQPLQQPAMHPIVPLLHPPHFLYDSRQDLQPTNLPSYPIQGRYGGAHSQFSGGWIDD